MMAKLILYLFFGVCWWLIKRDIAIRSQLSSAVWIPTLWLAILSSRPLSMWVGFGEGENTLEGSPIDRLFYFVLMFAALVTLSKRRLDWGSLISRNWPVFVFYGYLLISVCWANSPFSSLKRWTKEIGNILVLLVILTEVDPQEAFRAVFVRCGYACIPLSLILIRYFPEIGRHYNIHSGEIEPIGVTCQKNSLGTMVMVCGLVLVWDWLERTQPGETRWKRIERYLPLSMVMFGLYLLKLCDSKTSIVCLMVGGGILLATRFPVVRRRLAALGVLGVVGMVAVLLLDQLLGIKEMVLEGLGRDATFTGRTDVWRELLGLHTDPFFGTGFMSLWDDMSYRARLPDWVAASAHNGYLEIYLAGGFVGVFLLILMLILIGVRLARSLGTGGDYAVVRWAVFVMCLLANFSESNFGSMTPMGFLFLLAAIGHAETYSMKQTLGTVVSNPEQRICGYTGTSVKTGPLARAAQA